LLKKMPSNDRFQHYAFHGAVCVTALILVIFLLVNPADVPASVKGLDEWVGARWTVFIWIIVAICISDFVIARSGPECRVLCRDTGLTTK
jgi:hypothetical protein